MKAVLLIIGLLLIGTVLGGCSAPPADSTPTVSDQSEVTEQQVIEEIDNTFVEDQEVDVGELY
ncbi:MAG: hypothetical protein KJ601_07770 [Nanoarchaeota archaeon]|nr:hypothetical protein [Nanoarchaeota archaeon]MBU1704477.1 hypothetical protein [Nanoarchaeota archaeon]